MNNYIKYFKEKCKYNKNSFCIIPTLKNDNIIISPAGLRLSYEPKITIFTYKKGE